MNVPGTAFHGGSAKAASLDRLRQKLRWPPPFLSRTRPLRAAPQMRAGLASSQPPQPPAPPEIPNYDCPAPPFVAGGAGERRRPDGLPGSRNIVERGMGPAC